MPELPYERIDAPAGRVIFVCDHAARALPQPYGTLGLDDAALTTHIAYDIGAAEVTRALAQAFAAPAVLARWSRLLIDLNRGPDDPTLVMQLSDGRIIPGNRNISSPETNSRLANFHAPYHAAIEAEIARSRTTGAVPAVISIHSFTPVWKGRARPWEIGVLWDRDPRLASPLLARLGRAGFVVGDNQPYSGELENDCLYRHGTMNGLPHVLIEIRQDLIATKSAQMAFALRLKPIIVDAVREMGEPALRFTRPLATGKGVPKMDERTRIELEAAVFERLVAHLRSRTDVQNIDMMVTAGFCRNCLGDWYREAAAQRGITLGKDEAREIVYGMPPQEWKQRFQKEASPKQMAAFERTQKSQA